MTILSEPPETPRWFQIMGAVIVVLFLIACAGAGWIVYRSFWP